MTNPTPKTLEEHIAHARRMALWYADHTFYRLNPDPSYWEGIVKAIGRQAYTHGFGYCP